MPEVRTLLTGLGFGESPRWHEGRLWFSKWGMQEVVAVDPEGKSEVMVHVPTTIPFWVDWLRDGCLLVVSGTSEVSIFRTRCALRSSLPPLAPMIFVTPATRPSSPVALLKRGGKVVEARYDPDEGHGCAKRENQIDALKSTVEWY